MDQSVKLWIILATSRASAESPSHELSYVVEESRIAWVSTSHVLQSVCRGLSLDLQVLKHLNYQVIFTFLAKTCIFLSWANSLFWASCRMRSGRGGAERGMGTDFWRKKAWIPKRFWPKQSKSVEVISKRRANYVDNVHDAQCCAHSPNWVCT